MDGWRDRLQALEAYETWLDRQPLSPRTRGEYLRWVRLFCGWLGDEVDDLALGADPLADLAARDYAARDFKRFLKSERALGPASVNLALAAVDHLYRQLGLGRANVRREALPVAAPTNLVRQGEDLVMVGEIAGHVRIETTRRYSLPSKADRQAAMERMDVESDGGLAEPRRAPCTRRFTRANRSKTSTSTSRSPRRTCGSRSSTAATAASASPCSCARCAGWGSSPTT